VPAVRGWPFSLHYVTKSVGKLLRIENGEVCPKFRVTWTWMDWLPLTATVIVAGHQPFHPFHFGPRPFHFGNPLDPGQRVPDPLVGTLPFKLTGKYWAQCRVLLKVLVVGWICTAGEEMISGKLDVTSLLHGASSGWGSRGWPPDKQGYNIFHNQYRAVDFLCHWLDFGRCSGGMTNNSWPQETRKLLHLERGG